MKEISLIALLPFSCIYISSACSIHLNFWRSGNSLLLKQLSYTGTPVYNARPIVLTKHWCDSNVFSFNSHNCLENNSFISSGWIIKLRFELWFGFFQWLSLICLSDFDITRGKAGKRCDLVLRGNNCKLLIYQKKNKEFFQNISYSLLYLCLSDGSIFKQYLLET